MKLKLNQRLTPFSLKNTLQCGQLFRWEKRGGWWYGIVERKAFKVRQKGGVLEFEGVDCEFVRSYFRLDDNLPQIISAINRDHLTKQAIQAFFGLRIARQTPWECLISYICATYKNIPAIKNMIFELSKRFGEKIVFENCDFYTFPEPATIANATLNELRKCKLGFRAKRVRETAKMVDSNKVDFETLKKIDYETAKSKLLQLPGVGNKVADCVLLFSLEKLEAFPVDVWMKRIVQEYYTDYFDASFVKRISAKSLSSKDYNRINSFARDYFGKYAGYAQEYLFHFVRSKHGH
jgi:N-glycosylase/DNA lyase